MIYCFDTKDNALPFSSIGITRKALFQIIKAKYSMDFHIRVNRSHRERLAENEGWRGFGQKTAKSGLAR